MSGVLRRRRWRHPRRGCALAAAAGLALPLITWCPASATWAASGSGQGQARAITLSTVQGVVATCPLGASSATVTWPTLPEATSYAVQRSTTPGIWVGVGTTTSPPFVDSGIPLLVGLTVRWRIVASLGPWSAPGSEASNAVLVSALGVCL
jgi:hypothetical protein